MAHRRPPVHPSPGDLADLSTRLRQASSRLQVDLDDRAAERLVAFGAELIRWNQRVDLVGPTDLPTLLARHVLDSLALVPALRARQVRIVADLGSGAGLPGLALALLDPETTILSIEPRERRAAFQRHVVRQFALDRVRVLAERVGEGRPVAASGLDPAPEAVVARAFAALPDYLALAAPLVRAGGLVIAMRGPEGLAEAAPAGEAAARAGLVTDGSEVYDLPGDLLERSSPRRRVLLLYRRVQGPQA